MRPCDGVAGLVRQRWRGVWRAAFRCAGCQTARTSPGRRRRSPSSLRSAHGAIGCAAGSSADDSPDHRSAGPGPRAKRSRRGLPTRKTAHLDGLMMTGSQRRSLAAAGAFAVGGPTEDLASGPFRHSAASGVGGRLEDAGAPDTNGSSRQPQCLAGAKPVGAVALARRLTPPCRPRPTCPPSLPTMLVPALQGPSEAGSFDDLQLGIFVPIFVTRARHWRLAAHCGMVPVEARGPREAPLGHQNLDRRVGTGRRNSGTTSSQRDGTTDRHT